MCTLVTVVDGFFLLSFGISPGSVDRHGHRRGLVCNDPYVAVGLGGIVVVAHSLTIDDPEESK
jgi:hypothetical protein